MRQYIEKYKKLGGRAFFKSLIRAAWLREDYLVFRNRLVDKGQVPKECRVVLNNPHNADRSEADVVIFRLGMQADIPWLVSQFPTHYQKENLLQLFSIGDNLMIGFIDSEDKEICYISWFSEFDELFLAFTPFWSVDRAVCIKHMLVPEKFRRKGIAKCGFDYRQKIAYELGYRETYGFVLKNNIAPQKIYRKNKYTIIGLLSKRIFLGKETYQFTKP